MNISGGKWKGNKTHNQSDVGLNTFLKFETLLFVILEKNDTATQACIRKPLF